MIDTKAVETRDVACPDLDALEQEIDAIDQAHASGALTTTGNWSAGQNLWHIAKVIECSYNGFPFKAPLPLRIMGRFMKGGVLKKPLPKGIKLKGGALTFVPPEGVSFEDGLANLRSQLGRIKNGEKMTQASPFFGAMSHEEWLKLHMAHCRLHLGFLQTGQ